MARGAPSLLQKINAVKFWILNPCQAPWYVYIETMKEPAANTAQALLMFDLGDAMRSLFRPKGDRKGRHGRKKPPRRRRRNKGLPEPSDMIFKPIANALGLGDRQIQQGPKSLWKIDGIAQRGLYHLMVLNLTTDFLYDWALGIISDEESDCRFGRVKGNQEEHHINGGQGYGFLKADGEIEFQEGDCQINFGTVTVGPGNWLVVACARARTAATGNPETEVGLALSITGKPSKMIATSGNETVDTAAADLACSHMIKGPGSVQLRCKADPWRAVYGKITLMATQVTWGPDGAPD